MACQQFRDNKNKSQQKRTFTVLFYYKYNSLARNKWFQKVVENCVLKLGVFDPDYYKCIGQLSFKTNYLDIQCCGGRLMNYKCFRTLLTTKCNVSKEKVQLNDDQHYNYWNDLKVPYLSGKCSGGRQEALEHCKMTDELNHLMNVVNDSSNYMDDDSYADLKFIVDNSDDWLSNLLKDPTTTPSPTEAPKLIQLLFGRLNEYQITVKVEKKSNINNQDYLT